MYCTYTHVYNVCAYICTYNVCAYLWMESDVWVFGSGVGRERQENVLQGDLGVRKGGHVMQDTGARVLQGRRYTLFGTQCNRCTHSSTERESDVDIRYMYIKHCQDVDIWWFIFVHCL